MSKIQNFDAEHLHPSHHQLPWFHAPPSLSPKPISRNQYIVHAIIIIISTTPPLRALLFDYTSPASIIIFDTSSRSLTCYWYQHAQSFPEKGIVPQEKGSVDTLDTLPLPQQNIDSEEIDSEEIREVRQSRDSEKGVEVCQVCQACK